MTRPRVLRVASLVLLTAAVYVSSAGAAELAPNGGFELVCGPPTAACNWTFGGARESGPAHSGTADLSVSAQGPNSGDARSDCVADTQATHNVSGWYRTGYAGATISIHLNFYSDAGCSSLASSGSVSATSVGDGAWHQLSGSVTATPPGQSMRIELVYDCGFASCNGFYFDDISVTAGPPTAALAWAVSARRTRRGVVVSWRGEWPTHVLAYEVWRSSGGAFHKETSTSAGRDTYRWLDPTGRRATRYRIVAVGLDGRRTVGASVTAR